MNSIRKGAIHLFRFAGIDVSLHWSWFLVAAFEISREHAYSSAGWNVAEYLALFLIVMLHEFGHALACRQVGGVANEIVLWPLGGVAYVDPPQRPGATLWSLAAGPLVNVALVPVTLGALVLAHSAGWAMTMPNLYHLLYTVAWYINLGLLIFNILPIYPLDGGQILRSLLWFGIGRARSLMAAVIVGFAGVALLVVWAAVAQSVWMAAIAAFILLNCWSGLRHAQALLKIAKLPRRPGFACPSCNTSPPLGSYWGCSNCGTRFDTFETQAVCPQCRAQFPATGCLDCGRRYPIAEWRAAGFTPGVAPAGGVSRVIPSGT